MHGEPSPGRISIKSKGKRRPLRPPKRTARAEEATAIRTTVVAEETRWEGMWQRKKTPPRRQKSLTKDQVRGLDYPTWHLSE